VSIEYDLDEACSVEADDRIGEKRPILPPRGKKGVPMCAELRITWYSFIQWLTIGVYGTHNRSIRHRLGSFTPSAIAGPGSWEEVHLPSA